MTGKRPLMSLPSQPGQAKPNPQQKRFNSLLKKIETHRSTLAGWSAAEPAYLKQWGEAFVPVIEKIRAQQLELLRVLDSASSRIKLSKKDQEVLSDIICDLAEGLIESTLEQAEEDELKTIFARHAGEDFDELQQQDMKLFKARLEEEFDIEIDDSEHITSAEDLAEFVFDKIINDAEASKEHTEPRKKTAHQKRQEEDLAKGSQSLREIYRKLASALHPDRETDDAERHRKTALMQRVNQAYAEKNLLGLLELQLEIEQIDLDHINGLPQERLKHYNRVLAEQAKDLEEEISLRNMSFNAQFQLEPFETTKPAFISRKCDARLRDLRAELMDIEFETEDLRESPKNLKPWLRAKREMNDEMLAMLMLEDLYR